MHQGYTHRKPDSRRFSVMFPRGRSIVHSCLNIPTVEGATFRHVCVLICTQASVVIILLERLL